MNEQEPNSSPLPMKEAPPVIQKEEEPRLDFSSAIKLLNEGKKMTRLEWDNNKIYGFMKEDVLSLHQEDNRLNHWIISRGDIEATDWVIVK